MFLKYTYFNVNIFLNNRLLIEIIEHMMWMFNSILFFINCHKKINWIVITRNGKVTLTAASFNKLLNMLSVLCTCECELDNISWMSIEWTSLSLLISHFVVI